MKIWKNTKTLDAFLPGMTYTESAEEADLAIIGGKKIALGPMPNLKGIFKCGIGTDNIPFEEAKKRNIAIGLPSQTTAEAIYEETANYAVHLILQQLYKNTGDLEKWTKAVRPALSARQVLIIGTGNIGGKVANKLNALVKVDTFDAMTNQAIELEEKIKQADAISLHIPLSPKTENFFDAAKLGWMQEGASLINTARGPLVDESALLQKIEAGTITAAFDVFWKEPYHGPLRKFHPERFFMSPHISSNSNCFLEGLAEDFKQFAQHTLN
ncbi:MAG: hypothetical protein MK080_01730 [Opitutales bacterium]|nr:hypothetical protein [Opitutales bacterium]